jgi:hypothetical protein
MPFELLIVGLCSLFFEMLNTINDFSPSFGPLFDQRNEAGRKVFCWIQQAWELGTPLQD